MGCGPFGYGRNLRSNGFHAFVRDQMAQIFNLWLSKETLRKFKNKVVLKKHLKSGLQVAEVITEGDAIDKDVIEEDDDKAS